MEIGDGSSVCSPFTYVGLDEPCGADLECALGTVCVYVPGLPARSCVAEAAPGGTCYAIGNNCPVDEYCLADEPPPGEIASLGNCVPRKAIGEACEAHEECGPFAECWCGVCEGVAQIGEGCRGRCWSGACVDGVCAPPGECL